MNRQNEPHSLLDRSKATTCSRISRSQTASSGERHRQAGVSRALQGFSEAIIRCGYWKVVHLSNIFNNECLNQKSGAARITQSSSGLPMRLVFLSLPIRHLKTIPSRRPSRLATTPSKTATRQLTSRFLSPTFHDSWEPHLNR